MTGLNIAALVVAGGILVFLLFMPPIVGLADQADYGRIMNAFKIEYPPELSKADRYTCYLQAKFIITPERKAGRGRIPYFSSELMFVGAAVALQSIFVNRTNFDIQVLGFTHAIGFLGALALVLFSSRKLGRAGGILLAGLCVLIFCDAGYVTYFNSFYSEPASYIFGLAYIGSTLLLVQAGGRSYKRLLLCALSACAFITAKPQNIPLALPIVCFFLFCVRPLEPAPRLWGNASVASACIIVCLGGVSFRRVPEGMKRANVYNSIFSGLLPLSPIPGQISLRSVSSRNWREIYAGTNSWSPNSYDGTEIYHDSAGGIRLVWFYISHPARLCRMIILGSALSLSNRYRDLANYERSSGLPCLSLTSSFTWWDRFRSTLNKVWFLALFFLANVFVPLRTSRDRTGEVRVLLQFHAIIALMAVLSFWIAILGDGRDFQKHLFLFNFLFDCCVIGDVLWLAHRVFSRTTRQPSEAAKAANIESQCNASWV